MAVPPIQRSQKAAAAGSTRAVRFPWLLDALLGLLIVAALPLAIVAIPNTVSVVADLLPSGIDRIALMRAHGLALPAMMITVPLAAVALRRMNVAHILVGGLTLLALADAAGGFAGSTFFVAVLRVLHGVGAGIVIPATLVAAWGRPPILRAIWAGMLAVSLLSAQALALWPLDGAENWKITLQPYPMLSGIGLALAALYLMVWLVRGESPAAAPRAAERNRLLLAAVPAAGIAVLAISSASDSWPPGLVVLVALLSVAALLALASIGTFEGPAGRSLAYATVAVGTVLLPSVAQLTYIEMGGLGGPGLKGLWLPFVIAGVVSVSAAAAVVRWGGSITWLTPAGLFSMVLGLCAVRVLVPASEGLVLVVPFVLLGVGAAVALTAGLRHTGAGAALFALALCFPGVLSGYLLGTGLQVLKLHDVQTAQEVVDGFVGALHLWALIGGFLVVAVIVLAGLLGRRSAKRAGTAGASVDESASASAPSVESAVEAASAVEPVAVAEGSVEPVKVVASVGGGSDVAGPYEARGSAAVVSASAGGSTEDAESSPAPLGDPGDDGASETSADETAAGGPGDALGAGADEAAAGGTGSALGASADETAVDGSDGPSEVGAHETAAGAVEDGASGEGVSSAPDGGDGDAGADSGRDVGGAAERDELDGDAGGGSGRNEGNDQGGADSASAEMLRALEEEDRPTGEVPRIEVSMPVKGLSVDGAGPAQPSAETTGPLPVVPPPTQSPEDTAEQ